MIGKYGDVEVVDDSKSIKEPKAELPKLSPLQVKQLEFLMKEYPSLDLMCLESILRLTEDQKDRIVDEIKSGDLKHSEPLVPEDCIIQAVKVSD